MVELKKVDISLENKVLGYLITSTPILNEIRRIVDPVLFESNQARIISGWIVDYYDKSNEAPGKTIADIYAMRKSELQEADSQMVYAFLQNCSEKWKPTNIEYSKKICLDYIQERSMKRLVERLNSKVGSGSIIECQKIISDYMKPDTYHSDSLDIMGDAGFISKAMRTEEEEIFVLPGDLGKITGSFCRGDFVSFLAPPKRGKTWWMMYTAMNAYLQGNNVLFISLEMTKEQMARRFWQYISGCSRFGEKVDVSVFESCGEERWQRMDYTYQTSKVSDEPNVIKSIQEKTKKYTKGKLVLRNYPTGSLSLRDLKSELKNLEVFENFVPDVIVLDYADIMKMNNTKDKRFGLDELWLGLRGLNLETNTCLVTASQSGRATVTGEKDASEEDIAEAVSKLNHVTKMITINQNKDDKKHGIYRLNCNTTRDGNVVFDTAVVTSCLAIGRPYMDCHLLSHVDMGQSKDDEPRMSGFKRS